MFRIMERIVSPLLSVPHAAAAFGLAFLIAPSGLLMRAVSPWASGFEQPPDLLIVHDRLGLAMMAGLVAKEVPFLFLMVLAALPQARASERAETRRVDRLRAGGRLRARGAAGRSTDSSACRSSRCSPMRPRWSTWR